MYSIISFIELDARTGLITGTFAPEIGPYLLNLAGLFTTVEIETLLTLRSPHTHRVYWILRSHMYKGIYEVTVEDFRKQLLGENHQDHYPQYYDFKRFILEPVLKEINETGWPVTVEEIKAGLRKIYGLKFRIPDQGRKAKAAKKRVAAPKPGQPEIPFAGDAVPLNVPQWFAQHPKRDPALQYRRLVEKFGLSDGDARHLIESLRSEAEFLKLTKAMFDVLNPKAGEPPIANKGAVLKARLGAKK